MSIKNIIQQENDLQEMSTQSLANYLNNPTGQYNPYLVAGELQRKEAFAQRQMTEAPQGTVVDELVAKTMPMGRMPMPRPQEAMVSDTITETGIANLPAPNIGQNYAEGGIIGYKEGGLNKALDLIEKIPVVGKKISRKVKGIRDVKKIVEKKLKKKPTTPTKPKQGELFPKVKPKVTKPKVTKPKVTKPKSKPGAVDRAIGRGVGRAADLATTGIAYPLAGAIKNPYTAMGLGALGYGASKFFGETDEERIKREQEKFYNSPEQVQKRAAEADARQNAKDEQARANAAEVRRREKERRAYLALALGGAKTMAGQSPYALSNIGEGLGTGVAGLVELDEAAAARQSATDIAEQKQMYDLYKQNQAQINEFNELKLKLRGGDDGGRMLGILGAKLEDEGIEITDLSNPRYIALENETIIEMYPSMVPRGGAIVGGQAFIGA